MTEPMVASGDPVSPNCIPPFDKELEAVLDAFGPEVPRTITLEMIPALRKRPNFPGFATLVAETGADEEVRIVPGHNGDDIAVSVFRRPGAATPSPAIYYIHGGGMVAGDRLRGLHSYLPFIASHSVKIVTVEYRLAPEFSDPYPVEDSYAGLMWTVEHAAELGIDPSRILVVGTSAGGGLAAGVGLLARDRKGPTLCGQLLAGPMLDDRCLTPSSHQFQGIGVWDRASNMTAWKALLGDRQGTDNVSIYAAPGRAEDLSGLPPTYLEVGSVEVFRDEVTSYASKLWEAGGNAELHVWAGAFHGFDLFAPHAQVARTATETRNRWLGRILEA